MTMKRSTITMMMGILAEYPITPKSIELWEQCLSALVKLNPQPAELTEDERYMQALDRMQFK